MPDALKTDATKVRGCSASVWVYPTVDRRPASFPRRQQCGDHQGHRRARPCRGPGQARRGGRRAGRRRALAPFDLRKHLSANRTQGVPNMIALVKNTAERFALRREPVLNLDWRIRSDRCARSVRGGRTNPRRYMEIDRISRAGAAATLLRRRSGSPGAAAAAITSPRRASSPVNSADRRAERSDKSAIGHARRPGRPRRRRRPPDRRAGDYSG